MSRCFACICACSLYTMCMLGTCGGKKRASNPLDLTLQIVLNLHVCVGKQTHSLGQPEPLLTMPPLQVLMLSFYKLCLAEDLFPIV